MDIRVFKKPEHASRKDAGRVPKDTSEASREKVYERSESREKIRAKRVVTKDTSEASIKKRYERRSREKRYERSE